MIFVVRAGERVTHHNRRDDLAEQYGDQTGLDKLLRRIAERTEADLNPTCTCRKPVPDRMYIGQMVCKLCNCLIDQ